MCGICGFTGPPNDAVLKKMAHTIFHRGPDEAGFLSGKAVSLGIRRLSIIDVDTGHQPIHNEDKSVWVVFNGEIYNFQSLRDELTAKGHVFNTHHSDTETIVHLYEEEGEDFVHRLNGMFAIALWDKRSETLRLFRDRMGVKPLFYTLVQGRLVFGSELKAILAHPSVSRSMNHEAVFHYFSFKNIPAPMTAFEGIHCLSPGEMLTFCKGRVERKKWWRVRFAERNDYTEDELKQQIMSLLEDATRIRMVSDVPIGAYLSGGVDSSSVVALMSRFSSQPVKTFALGYEDELANKEADLHYARTVAKEMGTEHHEYIMKHGELLEDLDRVLASFDQPFSGVMSTYFLSKLISKHVKVALTGDGADELFGSYLSHRLAVPMSHAGKLYEKVRDGSISQEEKALLSSCDQSTLMNLYEKSGGEEAAWRHMLTVFTDQEKEGLLSGGFKSQFELAGSLELIESNFASLTASGPLNRVLEMEWNTQLPDQVLAFVDFLSMAHSVEARSPFLDYRLVEFVATIPCEFKIRGTVVKDILKKSVAPIIPEGIIHRPKEGFVLPVFEWMTSQMKTFCSDTLSEERLQRHGLFNYSYVHTLLVQFDMGEKRVAGKIWNLMMFQLWWERYFN